MEWSAPEGCPDHAVVMAEAARVLAMSPGSAMPQRARGTVTLDGAGWRLSLEIIGVDGSGTRTFRDASCAGFAQVAGLAIALSATPQVPAPPVQLEPALDRPAARFLVRLLLGGDLGTLRGPSPGPGLAFGGFLGRTRIEGRLQYWFAQTAEGVQDQLVSGGVGACQALTEGLEVGLCVGLEGGRLEARRVDTGASTRGAWLALQAGAALGWELVARLAVRVEVSLGLTLVAPNFEAISPGARGPVALFGRGTLGLEWRF